MGSHGDELPVDLRLVARYICVTEHVVSIQKVARSDHRGPMDAREAVDRDGAALLQRGPCLLYTSPSPRDATLSRMPSSA